MQDKSEFIKLEIDNGMHCIVNKKYIISAEEHIYDGIKYVRLTLFNGSNGARHIETINNIDDIMNHLV